jgi:hypothetical protein
MKRLLFGLLLAGCGTSHYQDERRYHEPVGTSDELEAAKRQLADNERALAGAKVEGRPVDCAKVTKLGDNICTLSERICTLVERLPDKAADCTDARARCAGAREKVKAACPKPPGEQGG